MSRTFKTVDYAQAPDLTVRLGDCLPPDHLARFVVDESQLKTGPSPNEVSLLASRR